MSRAPSPARNRARGPLWVRARRRLRRELGVVRGLWADARDLRAWQRGLLDPREMQAVIERLAQDPRSATTGLVTTAPPAQRLAAWRRAHGDWSEQAVSEAGDARRDAPVYFGFRYRLDDADAWHRDPLRSAPWPRRPRAALRLGGAGDLRMQWEPARFHHALLLARAWSATQDPVYPEAFLRHVDSFERGNPPYRGIHWAVGMEVAIRAAAIVFALEHFRNAPPLDEVWRARLVRLLLLHGHFLEHHLERHPHGFTTNHTISDHAGLAVLGRLFASSARGRRWLDLAAAGLAASLEEQVLGGGAHAEASLPYERYVLEAALTGAHCLDPAAAASLRAPIARLARHLCDARMPSGLPFVGDGDESFFPPFGYQPYAARDPFDPEPPLQVAASWLEQPELRGAPQTREEAYAFGLPVQSEIGSPAQRSAGEGLVRFNAGPFAGIVVTRAAGTPWMSTHNHNDLLAIALDVAGAPAVIDPGTGVYHRDLALRHALRSTAAHATVQLDGLEQSPLRREAVFEGPASVPGGCELRGTAPLRLRAWHRGWEGAGAGIEHMRRVSWRLGLLCIEDLVGPEIAGDPSAAHTTVLRFPLASGLTVALHSRGECRVALAGGELRFLLLRPREGLWQILPGCAARRYGDRSDTWVLTAAQTGPLPHRWLTVLRFHAPSEWNVR